MISTYNWMGEKIDWCSEKWLSLSVSGQLTMWLLLGVNLIKTSNPCARVIQNVGLRSQKNVKFVFFSSIVMSIRFHSFFWYRILKWHKERFLVATLRNEKVIAAHLFVSIDISIIVTSVNRWSFRFSTIFSRLIDPLVRQVWHESGTLIIRF